MTYFRVNENFYGFQFVVFCGNGVVSSFLKNTFPVPECKRPTSLLLSVKLRTLHANQESIRLPRVKKTAKYGSLLHHMIDIGMLLSLLLLTQEKVPSQQKS